MARGPFGVELGDDPLAFPRGCRVRVNDDLIGGLGVVAIPTIPGVEYSPVGVEFDDAPGFVWQMKRELVERER